MSPILIESIQAIVVDLPTIRPHKLAMHTMQKQTLVVIRAKCSDGIEGIGESTTIGGLAYGNESPESIKQNIDSHLGPLLVGQDAANINVAMLRLDKAAKGNTFAKSGLESALLDAQGKRIGLPVSELLGGRVPRAVLRTAQIAEVAGIALYGGTMLEGAIGTLASAHAFVTLNKLTWGTELFGPLLLTEEIVAEPPVYRDFHLEVPRTPGLGLTLDEERLAFFSRT
ncbi:enolase C-terminal domain-like protein [Stutzerimonas chloritidismutans]